MDVNCNSVNVVFDVTESILKAKNMLRNGSVEICFELGGITRENPSNKKSNKKLYKAV